MFRKKDKLEKDFQIWNFERNGKMEKWKNGKMEKWKNGKMEKWKNGKMEKWKRIFRKKGEKKNFLGPSAPIVNDNSI